MWFPYPIRLIVIYGIMLSVVPITGFLCFGNLKQAWQYTRDWAIAIGWIILAAGIVALIVWPFMPPPNP